MRRSRCVWVVGLAAAVCGLTACEAGRASTAPSVAPQGVESTAARVEAAGPVTIAIKRGTLDIRSQSQVDLAIFANQQSNKFAWEGRLAEGLNPINLHCPCAPGATVSIDTTWAGRSLTGTTLTWHGVTYTNIGGLTENSGGQVQLLGSVVMPPYRGQTTARVTTTFTASDTFFLAFDPQGAPEAQLTLTGGGTARVWLTWVPVPLPPSLPDGYWDLTRVLYKFKHQ